MVVWVLMVWVLIVWVLFMKILVSEVRHTEQVFMVSGQQQKEPSIS